MAKNRQPDDAAEAAKAVPAGDELAPETRAAILRLIEEIDRLRAELEANNRRIAYLEELADGDPLTPAINRRAFMRELERFKAYADRYGASASVIYLDIDGMKAVNDRFGHATGDELLVAVANTLIANVRSSDVVGRLGGDEFGVLLAQTDAKAAEDKAAALAGLLAEIRVGRDGEAGPVAAAWGVVPLDSAHDAAAALEAADRAMYRRKARPAGGKVG